MAAARDGAPPHSTAPERDGAGATGVFAGTECGGRGPEAAGVGRLY